MWINGGKDVVNSRRVVQVWLRKVVGIGLAAGDTTAYWGGAGADTAPNILTFSVILARQPIRNR